MTRLSLRIGATLVAVAVPALALAAPAQAAPVEIDLLTVNDFHGRLETSGAVGGAAVLAGAANEFRASNPNTLFAGAGDLIGASTFTSFIQDDNPSIDALNAAGLDISSVGNHEYDQGWSDLRDDVIGGSDGHAASWPYLAANVVLKSTGEPAPETPPFEIVESGGVRIGFIGAVTDELPSLVSPEGIVDLEVLPVVESVNAYADDLADGDESNGEADVVILLVHEDAEGAIQEGANDNIDVIVAGHTHETYATVVDGRPIIQTGQYATNIGHIGMTVDPDTGEVVFDEVENLPLMNDDDGDGVFEPNYTPDPEVAQIVADAVAVADELGAEQLGEVTANVTRAFDIGIDAETGEEILVEDRGEESTLGNLVADAQLASTEGSAAGPAQIAFMNPGGIRADICYAQADYPYEEGDLPVCAGVPDDGGVITYREAATVQPFANTLVRMTLTGEQIRDVLLEQLQPEGSSRPFLHLGVSDGLVYTYDIERDEAGLPTAFDVTSITLDGLPVEADASYEVVVNSFLASGGDNFPTFTEGTDVADTGQIDLESFVDYMAAYSPVSPDTQERALDNSLVGSAIIEWPAGLGDPPAMEVGTTREFSLVTDLPIALPEDFVFTVDAPDGVEIEYGTRTDGREFPTTIEGLPAGESTLPITVKVAADAVDGDYELVFTLERAGDSSVFDGNPLTTPSELVVPFEIVGLNDPTLPPTGGSSAAIGALGVGAVLAGGLLVALAARRMRQTV